MMNDRFSAELRQHLLATADDRPASGQLAAIVDGVAATPQRRPIATRLPWIGGRVDPFPSLAVRFGLIAAALLIVIVAAALLAGGQPGRTVFEGTWTAIDAGDGSTRTIVIGAGPSPEVRYTDDFAGGAACADDAVKVFTAKGAGEIDGDRLDVTWLGGGGCGLTTVPMGDGYYVYDQATDTLLDGLGVTWVRAPDGVVPPSGPPSPIPANRRGECFDLAAGETYSNDVGGMTLTVHIPIDGVISWQGRGRRFGLAGDCQLLSGPPFIEASIVTSVDASCERGDTVAVRTPAEAVAALASARGLGMAETAKVGLGGFPATRFELAPDSRMCFGEVVLWNDFVVHRGTTIIYVVDVRGVPLGVTIADATEGDTVEAIREAEAILASLRIDGVEDAHPSSAPVPTPDPACLQFDGAGTYTAPVGPLSVTATLPDDATVYWSGSRDWFRLGRSPCGFDAPLTFETQLVTKVAVDACKGLGDSVEVRSAAEAASALADQVSTAATAQTDISIDGHPGVRVQITVQSGLDTVNCDEGATLLLGQSVEDSFIRIDPGWIYTVHLVDVNGSILAITALYEIDDRVDSAAMRAEIHAIIGSLELG